MKKNLLFVALTGAALVSSCVSDEVVNVQEQQKQVRIGFSSPVLYESAESRANCQGEITGTYKYDGSIGEYTYPQEENFKIFAIQHKGEFISWTETETTHFAEFNNQDLSYDRKVDAWAPKKADGGYCYWPIGEKMSFAAMSPADLETVEEKTAVSYGDNGLTIKDFVVPAVERQFDLMYSNRITNQTSANMGGGSADHYSGIPLVFKHALSSIHFSLKVDPEVTETVVLTSIELCNAVNKGTFSENIGNKPTWDIINGSTVNYTAFTGAVTFPFEPQYVSALAASDTEDDKIDNIEDKSHALLILPQEFTNDLIIKVNYNVGDEPSYREIQVNKYPEGEGVNPLVAWEVGHRYTYRLYYSEESEKADMIYFAPSVEGWIPEPTIVVRL